MPPDFYPTRGELYRLERLLRGTREDLAPALASLNMNAALLPHLEARLLSWCNLARCPGCGLWVEANRIVFSTCDRCPPPSQGVT